MTVRVALCPATTEPNATVFPAPRFADVRACAARASLVAQRIQSPISAVPDEIVSQLPPVIGW